MADDDTIWSNLFLFVDSDGDGKVTTDDMKKVCCLKTFLACEKLKTTSKRFSGMGNMFRISR